MKKVFIWILVVVVIAVVVGMRVTKRGSEAPAKSIEDIHAAEGVPADVVTVTTGTVTVLREITGVVSGIRQSTLRSAFDQKIAAVTVVEGQRVKRGQRLIRFDTTVSPDRTAKLSQVREAYENAKRQVARLEPLFESGAVSESDLDAARTQLAIAKANLRDSRLEVEVVSPLDGVVTLVACRAGDAVDGGDVVAQVAVLDSVRVESEVSAETARELKVGAPAHLHGDDSSEVGTIARVALGANPDTRLFEVEAVLANPTGGMRPGITITLDVVINRVGPVLVIPPVAVIDDEAITPGTMHDVFIVRDGLAHKKQIEVGESSGESLEVRSGLAENDRIVVFGANRLDEGVRVRLHKVDGAAVSAPEEGNR